MPRVLLVVPAQEPLRESASKLETAVRNGVSLAQVFGNRVRLQASAADIGLGPYVHLDTSYAAVSLGTGGGAASLNSIRANNAENFVVRANVPEAMVREGYINQSPVFCDPDIAPFPAVCAGSPSVGAVPDVKALHRIPAATNRGLDGDRVAIAVMDTGISNAYLSSKGINGRVDASVVWNSLDAIAVANRIVPPGGHLPGHGTMCAFDALLAAPRARLLDYPILHNSGGGAIAGSVIGGTLGDALEAYAHLESFWLVTFGPTRGQYDSLVINNSWGTYHPSWDFPVGHPGRYIDNPNHPFNQKLEVMVRNRIDMVFAAGNCGGDCPDPRCMSNVTHSIMGANAHPEVLTVAGSSVAGGRIGYSSEGPPISGMGSSRKPDLAAATHFAGSDALGAGIPDCGTSAACPVAAGCVAALRTRLSPRDILAGKCVRRPEEYRSACLRHRAGVECPVRVGHHRLGRGGGPVGLIA